MTQCNTQAMLFGQVGRRQTVARFDGGWISSDGGALLLGEVERQTRIIERFSGCFTDHRDPKRIEHPLAQLIGQRVLGLALGYEDLNDHDALRRDPLLATVLGCGDPLGAGRDRASDRGKALAGKSTLNRVELTPVGASRSSRYKKIAFSISAFDRMLVEVFLAAEAKAIRTAWRSARKAERRGGKRRRREWIVLDIDATDDPTHGKQLGRFFHGYYDCYCYQPLYITSGEHVLFARLRPGNVDAARGAITAVSRVVHQIRERHPGTPILLRGDSGFCREPLMRWCEENGVDYVLGLAKNKRLVKAIGRQLHEAKLACEQTGEAARRFTDLDYRTQKSWSRCRRVVAKAEHLPGERGENPRFVVTSIVAEQIIAQTLYEKTYCARGDMENRIKEQQLGLFADRTSCRAMRANQVRLAMSTVGYTLMAALRRLGLAGTPMAGAQCSTIRVRLLKIGARVRITARKIWVSLSQSYPLQELFHMIHARLTASPPALGP